MKQRQLTPTPKQVTPQALGSKSTFKRIPKQLPKQAKRIRRTLRLSEDCCGHCNSCQSGSGPAPRIGCITCGSSGFGGSLAKATRAIPTAVAKLRAKLKAKGMRLVGIKEGGDLNINGYIIVEVDE